jgi:hypothetical protein
MSSTEEEPTKVVRFITTPGCRVVLEGNIDDVDRVYRLATHGLMVGGYHFPSEEERETIPKEPIPPIADIEHYRRRVEQLESEPLKVELIDTRRQKKLAEEAVAEIKQTVTVMAVAIERAYNALNKIGGSDEVKIAIARQHLESFWTP